jgi:hypothetical protein
MTCKELRVGVGLLWLVLCGCGQDWTALQRSDGRFVVEMPGTTQCGPAEEETPLGRLRGRSCRAEGKHVHLRPAEVSIENYSLEWYDLPARLSDEGAFKFVRGVHARFVRDIEARLVPRGMNEQGALLGNERGLQYEGSIPGKGESWHTRDLGCVHRDRLYVLRVDGPDPVDEQEWQRIRGSFKFVS